MKRFVWLAVVVAAVGCGGDTKPPPQVAPEAKPTAPPPKGKQAALPE